MLLIIKIPQNVSCHQVFYLQPKHFKTFLGLSWTSERGMIVKVRQISMLFIASMCLFVFLLVVSVITSQVGGSSRRSLDCGRLNIIAILFPFPVIWLLDYQNLLYGVIQGFMFLFFVSLPAAGTWSSSAWLQQSHYHMRFPALENEKIKNRENIVIEVYPNLVSHTFLSGYD